MHLPCLARAPAPVACALAATTSPGRRRMKLPARAPAAGAAGKQQRRGRMRVQGVLPHATRTAHAADPLVPPRGARPGQPSLDCVATRLRNQGRGYGLVALGTAKAHAGSSSTRGSHARGSLCTACALKCASLGEQRPETALPAAVSPVGGYRAAAPAAAPCAQRRPHATGEPPPPGGGGAAKLPSVVTAPPPTTTAAAEGGGAAATAAAVTVNGTAYCC
jgi:hypothetical protein